MDNTKTIGKQTDKDVLITADHPLACSHCGEPCVEELITEDEKHFCCSGCAMVFNLLKANGLDDFYDLDQTAGRSQRRVRLEDYSWLEDARLRQEFIDFEDETYCRMRLDLPSIHCSACIWLLENLNQLDEGVKSVQVNFAQKTANILFVPEQLSARNLADLLARIGYPPRFRKGKSLKPTTDKKLLYQIGLAGFVFGNIMLFSFPEYLGLSRDTNDGGSFQVLFGYLNLVLILPVLLFSGRDYLMAAYRGIRYGVHTVDIPIALGILALFFRSVYEVVWAIGPGYFDSLAGLLFFLLVGKWFQAKTFSRLSFDGDYRSYFPVAARKITENGQITPIGLSEVRPGDLLSVQPGGLIPVDGLLDSPVSVGIDYSFVTGESAAQTRTNGNRIYAGGRAIETSFKLIAEKKVEESYLLQLWKDAPGEQEPKQNLTDRLSKYFTRVVLSIALATCLYWYPTDIGKGLYAAGSVLIIACPCAIALAIPFCYGTIIRLLAKHGLYLKHSGLIEQFPKLKHFVLDKTGTLTHHEAISLPLIQSSWNKADMALVMAICQQSSHPKSKALHQWFSKRKILAATSPAGVKEIVGKGLEYGPWRIGSPDFCQIDRSEIDAHISLCVSYKGEMKAIFGQSKNQMRNGLDHFLKGLSQRGQLYVLSGDIEPTNTPWEGIISTENQHYECSPFDKKKFVADLQEKTTEGICMLGDGLNDTGALADADLGIAVSEDATTFAPAGDAILSADNLNQLPDFITFVLKTRWVLYAAYLFALAYNITGIIIAVQGKLSPVIAAILMPLSSITTVCIVIFGVFSIYHISDLHKSC
ncbi:MAG: heavy metal translocating P-type ATPase metal-binding domain-containing protein [Bacteroidota bacterium]